VAKPRDRWRVREHVKVLSGIRRWKASRAGKAHRVDARWVESVLAPHRHEAIELHGPGGARQGASEAAFGDRARGRKRRGTKAPHLRIRFEVPGDAFLPHGSNTSRQRTKGPKLEPRRQNADLLGARIAARWSGIGRQLEEATPRATQAGPMVSSRGARRLENRAKLTGARVESRLQKSVRSTFHVTSR